jgi:hypothetical protein
LTDPGRRRRPVSGSTDADCDRAPDMADRLPNLGYTDVRLYRDGIEDWVAAGLPVEERGGWVIRRFGDCA